MKINFTKMHGAGNDYIYINGFLQNIDDPFGFSIFASDRHFGIGGDGIVLILPAENADATMRMFNNDGSEGKMCGNAIRCVGKYLYDNKIAHKTHLSINTLSGIKYLDLSVDSNDKVIGAKVDMGKYSLTPSSLPVISDKEELIDEPFYVLNEEVLLTCVSMGNPHAVCFVDDVDSLDLPKIGPAFENLELFPERVNTEFVQIIDERTVKMRVWERGSGETLACGTGASAVGVACVKKGIFKANVENTIKLIGGELKITVTDDKTVFMEGSATKVFEGEIEYEF